MEQIIDTLSNLHETQRYYAEWKKKKANIKESHTTWLHLYNILENTKL